VGASRSIPFTKWFGDGLIITGAPVELMEFEEVDYWGELVEIMNWATKNVFASLFLCWGSQAALYHYYKIPKYLNDKKIFGIFDHTVSEENSPLLRGFDEKFKAPHSRHTYVKKEDILKNKNLKILSESEKAGPNSLNFQVVTNSSLDDRVCCKFSLKEEKT
jgi:homoserine O-succinyltransferase